MTLNEENIICLQEDIARLTATPAPRGYTDARLARILAITRGELAELQGKANPMAAQNTATMARESASMQRLSGSI